MPSTTHIHGHQRRFYTSRVKESALGTAQDITNFFNALPGSGMTFQPNQYQQSQEFTGNEFEDRTLYLEHQSRGKIILNASLEALMVFGGFALGQDAVSIPAGATNTRLHTITPAALADCPLSFTIDEHLIGATDTGTATCLLYRGCCVDTFRIVIQRGGLARLEADIIASNAPGLGSSRTESGLTGPDIYIPATWVAPYIKVNTLDGDTAYDGAIAIPTTSLTNFTDLASGVSIQNVTNEITIEWKNNLLADQGHAPGGGRNMSTLFPGRRSCSVSMTLDDLTTAGISLSAFTSMISDTRQQRALQLTCVTDTAVESGYYKGWSIVIPRLELQAPIETSSDFGLVNRTFKFNVGQDTTADAYEPFYLFGWNAQTAAYCQ